MVISSQYSCYLAHWRQAATGQDCAGNKTANTEVAVDNGVHADRNDGDSRSLLDELRQVNDRHRKET